MEQQELINHLNLLVGVRYKEEPPYSTEQGFNCLAFCEYVYKLYGRDVETSSLKKMRSQFIRVKPPFEFLDIPLIYLSVMDTHHVGIMLDETWMIHCSRATNGVGRTDITRAPWCNLIRRVYRYK